MLLFLLACTAKQPAETDDSAIVDTGTRSGDSAATDDTATGDTAVEDTEAFAEDISVSVHPEVATLLTVTWTQLIDSEAVWLEYSFGDDLLTTPAQARSTGEHTQVLLGIPADTEVTLTLVTDDSALGPWTATTGALPDNLPLPTLLAWDELLTTDHRWVLGSVAAEAGRGNEPYWVVITDRLGRIVWYREAPYGSTTNWPRVARDGTHLIVDESNPFGIGDHEDQVRRMTLDLGFDETYLLDMGWIFGETDGGRILYDRPDEGSSAFSLMELQPDETSRFIWDCTAWLDGRSDAVWGCGANSIIWNPDTDSILWSMFDPSTVAEVDRTSGEVLRYFGQIDGGWAFDPPESVFDLQHYVHYSDEGTLLASSHLVDEAGEQRAHEFELDTDSETLRLIWSYGEGVDRYASGMGEVTRYGDSALINYGPQGYVREVTGDGELAWELDWDRQHLNGHSTLIDDLYALNQGWPGRWP